MGIFDSFEKKRPEENTSDMNKGTRRRGEEAAPGKWQVGDKVLDRYEIHDVKWGGMGIVYIAVDHEWNQTYAIKTFQDKFLWNKDVVNRFMSEAETWINLQRHTNIVFASFVEEIDKKPCIFLEYVEGDELSRYIGRLDVPHFLDFTLQFCDGMDYAYKTLGVIHRDIKPSNALITKDGTLKVTDFGLVKAIQEGVPEELQRGDTAVSRGMGTWPYMPPEQFPEDIQKKFHFPVREVTTRSDIYSFGVTFYQLLIGELPFQSVEHIFSREPVSPDTLDKNIPGQLGRLLIKCLSKDPYDRYKTFEQVRKSLIELYDTLPEQQKIFGHIYASRGYEQPLDAMDWHNRGVSLVALGRHQEALSCWDKALDIEPENAAAWLGKGCLLVMLNKYQEAIACLTKVTEVATGGSLVIQAEEMLSAVEKDMASREKMQLWVPDETKRELELVQIGVETIRWWWGQQDAVLVLREIAGKQRALLIVVSREVARLVESLLTRNESLDSSGSPEIQMLEDFEKWTQYVECLVLHLEENAFWFEVVTRNSALPYKRLKASEGAIMSLRYELPLYVSEKVMRSASLGSL